MGDTRPEDVARVEERARRIEQELDDADLGDPAQPTGHKPLSATFVPRSSVSHQRPSLLGSRASSTKPSKKREVLSASSEAPSYERDWHFLKAKLRELSRAATYDV